MRSERELQPVSGGEPNVADQKRRVAYDVWRPPGVDAEEIDSQIVITLLKGERQPQAQCTQAGRLTGQMIMGLEGSNMSRIDIELRDAQLEMRRMAGHIPPENTKTLEERIFMTPVEKSNV